MNDTEIYEIMNLEQIEETSQWEVKVRIILLCHEYIIKNISHTFFSQLHKNGPISWNNIILG